MAISPNPASKRSSRMKSRPQTCESLEKAGGKAEFSEKARRARAAWDTKRWHACLPEDPAQCRWPSGDYLSETNPLRFCAHKRRRHADTALASDPLPYCEEHAPQAMAPRRQPNGHRRRVIVSRYGNRYIIE